MRFWIPWCKLRETATSFIALRRTEQRPVDLDDARYAQLSDQVERWRSHALEIADRRELRHERDLDLDPDL